MGKVKRVYNSNYEVAIRVLLTLAKLPSKKSSIHRLIILDHLALNTFDIGGPASLHAPVPNRGVQVFSRKEVIEQSINLLISKDLLEIEPSNNGIEYKITIYGEKYLTFFESRYFNLLVERVNWVTQKFNVMNDEELGKFIRSNISKWGEEFITEDNLANKL